MDDRGDSKPSLCCHRMVCLDEKQHRGGIRQAVRREKCVGCLQIKSDFIGSVDDA